MLHDAVTGRIRHDRTLARHYRVATTPRCDARRGRGAGSGSAGGRCRRCAGGGGRAVSVASTLEIRLRQSRDGEPVLRPVPIRHPGRLCAARLRLSMDRLGDVRRGADGQRDEHRGCRQGRCDRGVPRRPEGFRPAGRKRARGRHPGVQLQCRFAHQQAPRLYRAGSVSVRPDDGRTHRQVGRQRQGRDIHRDTGATELAAPL